MISGGRNPDVAMRIALLQNHKVCLLLAVVILIISASTVFLCYGEKEHYELSAAGFGLPASVISKSISTDAKTGACLVHFSMGRKELYMWLSSSPAYSEVTGRDGASSSDLESLYDQSISRQRELLLVDGLVSGSDGRRVYVQVWVRADENERSVNVRVYLDPQ